MFSNEDYLADLLVEAGYITAVQLRDTRAALDANQTIIKYLLSAGTITEEQVSETLANNAGVPFVIIHQLNLDPSIITSIPDDVVRRFRAIPIADDGTFLTVAVSDPLNFETLDSLPHVTGREINFTCATPTDIANHLRQFYNSEEEPTKDINNEFNVSTGDTEAGAETGDAPVIRLVQQTLTDAFRLKASDIHIEPLETSVRVRYRLDGKLVHVDSHPKKLLPAIIARLKVMSGTMSIAEKRLPQDGRIQLKMGDKEVDLRVSSVPSNHGESIVMRILDKTALLLGLPELGFFSDDQAQFEKLLGLPDGIILVTGPTGSGKTTTLYACLNVINRPDKKIITVEDPVRNHVISWAKEYGVSQAALDDLVGKVVEMGFEAQQTSSVNLAEEKKALGPNADARINGMVKWASGLVNKGIWGKDDFEEFKYMGGTAKGIAALEKLRASYEGRVPLESAPVEGALSKEELYAMVGDPKYQTDPGFRKKVERMFEANFGSQ